MTDPYELLKLDRQLCFALYAASRSLTRLYREFLDPLGITYPQYLVFLVLFEQDDRTVSQIGSAMMLDSGTLTPLLKRLEAMDLIKRTRGKDDERTMKIGLTKKGRGLLEPLQKVSFNIDCILGLPEADMMMMRQQVMAIITKSEKAN